MQTGWPMNIMINYIKFFKKEIPKTSLQKVEIQNFHLLYLPFFKPGIDGYERRY